MHKKLPICLHEYSIFQLISPIGSDVYTIHSPQFGRFTTRQVQVDLSYSDEQANLVATSARAMNSDDVAQCRKF